jgi:tRNA dimethylallyltransferase
MKKHMVVFIVGPTGSGKTQIGLNLSKYLPCEYISADSMQVYKGMDIMTDKLPASLRRKYPYHLLDVIPPSKEYNVASFCLAATRKIKEIIKRKKIPVVVGGTGLYVRSLIHGIFEEKASAKVRSSLARLAAEKGNSFLHRRLSEVDPCAAARIHVHDTKRLIRALEVFEMTCRPISELQQKRQGLATAYDVRIFGLRRDRADLYARIDQRVDFMVHGGLLDEVRRLLRRRLGRTASQCIGVREMEGFLRGQYGWEEAVRLMKRNTRHLAKRQMTWFRREPGIVWIDVVADADLDAVARNICGRLAVPGLKSR